jgi:hypothetical protein
MRGKKGIELSINFIVILIISLIIFVGGLAFTNKFMKLAIDRKAELDQQTEYEIEQLLADGAPVAIPHNKKTTKIGKSLLFGLGINNIHREPRNFYVIMNFSKAFYHNSSLVETANRQFIQDRWIFSSLGNFTLDPNKHISVPLIVDITDRMANDQGTARATYIFNVCVCSPAPCEGSCDSTQPNLYGGHINLLYVEIP